MNYRRHTGYTIIEITTVVVIIGILAGITYMGYSWYIKNTKESAISQAVGQYQSLINQAVFEKNTAPGQLTTIVQPAGECLSDPTAHNNPNGTPCCLIDSSGSSPAIKCGNQNALLSVFSSSNTNMQTMNDITKGYLSGNVPRLPEISHSTLSNCALTLTTVPCWTKEIGYIATKQVPASSSPKGALVYYLPPDYDCQSKDVLVWDTSDGVYKYTDTQAYTTRTANYTECVVGIR
jgi:prepilin-type N-terminal cleavage/methylation domain-containing protein